VLLATGIPTVDDRKAAVGTVPCALEVDGSAGIARAILDNGAIDYIDASIGADNHARAALVTLHEGYDYLFQAVLELADSVVADAYFTRTDPFVPLDERPLPAIMPSPSKERFHHRLARFGVENAAVKIATAGDHFANTHLRLAWEANAATRDELVPCGFDPAVGDPATWASLKDLRSGLRRLRKNQLSVFAAFVLNAEFRALFGDSDLRGARRLRDEVVHRERPSYREVPAFGRASIWRSTPFHVKLPPPDSIDPTAPSIGDRRTMLANAIEATLRYGDACKDLAIRWLRTIDVWVTPGRETTSIQVTFQEGDRPPRFPREQRDPGQFLIRN
jgi:hypothetical protein